MDEEKKDFKHVSINLLNSADQNLTTMNNLFKSKDYSWALFMGHLVLEKILKALYVIRLNKHAIFTHDLLRLAKLTGLQLTETQEEWLDEITTFNINARYDNYKQDFNKLCTKDFTEIRISRIKNLREWLINQF